MRPRHLIALLLGLAVLSVPEPSAAGPRDWTVTNGNTDATGDPNKPTIELQGFDFGREVKGPGTPAWLRACTWKSWLAEEKDAYFGQFFAGFGSSPVAGSDPNEEWGVVFCNPSAEEAAGLNPSIVFTGVLATWALTDGLPQVVLDYLVALGYASVDIPVQIGDAAPFGDTRAPLITQLPTWLWVDPATWQPRSATTPPVFGVTATVTATPTRVLFENNDGDQVDCGPNLGPPYDFTRDDTHQHSDCTLTYHHTSAVGDWTLSSTIWWTVTYACSAQCGTGALPPFVVRNTRPVRIAELQAVLLPPPLDTP